MFEIGTSALAQLLLPKQHNYFSACNMTTFMVVFYKPLALLHKVEVE